MTKRNINGVSRELYGTWCQHGHHIFVVDDADDGPSPRTVAANPWPCDTCTPEDVINEMNTAHDWSP
jgi:hypothetical protein